MDDADRFERLARLAAHLAANLPACLADLEVLVGIDSGSYTKPGVDRVGSWMAGRLEDLGATLERVPHATLGDTWVATFEGGPPGPTVMLIGH